MKSMESIGFFSNKSKISLRLTFFHHPSSFSPFVICQLFFCKISISLLWLFPVLENSTSPLRFFFLHRFINRINACNLLIKQTRLTFKSVKISRTRLKLLFTKLPRRVGFIIKGEAKKQKKNCGIQIPAIIYENDVLNLDLNPRRDEIWLGTIIRCQDCFGISEKYFG